MSVQQTWEMAVVLFVLAAAVLVLLAERVYAGRQAKRQDEELFRMLDCLLDGRPLDNVDASEEGVLSKYADRLLKLSQLREYEKNSSLKDKETMKRLISDVAHQVKTPLASVDMLFETMQRQDISEEQRLQFAGQMRSQLDRLQFLMQFLIKASRLETGVIEVSMRRQSLYETLAQAVGGVLSAAEQKGLHVEIDCPPTLMACHDARWMGEALYNLLDNAVKYTPEGGTIQVRGMEGEMYVQLCVADTGIGVSPEHFHDIFKRFYREEKAGEMPGLGIGLYLTRQILDMQGGYVIVKNREGGGSEFWLYLPKRP